MEFLFDHYKKIKDPTLYLHNPDMKPISAIKARNRNFVLRFNDLSELTFEAPKYEKSKDGTMSELPYYSRLATKRLIKIDEIGWFQITQAVENEDGLTAYMSITAQSHQCAFKEKGFFCEGRLYKFYDESDPYDANYDSDKEDAIPSVVGQLYQQLGIKVAVAITDFEPDEDYGDWTIVYIDPALKYVEGATTNVCRAFKENSATYGYDFIVNSVENAFEVIFDFDFMHHAIKVKRVESVTQKTNIYLSFDNVVNELQTTEKADDIVTVLNCSGNDLDIRTVNPTGTNYIVDFSYYMDEVNYHWMSQELINKIKAWKALVDSKKSQYDTLVTGLRGAYSSHTEASSDIVYVKQKNQDLEAVRDQYIVDSTTSNMLFVAETIDVGAKSFDSNSPYYTTALADIDERTCYSSPPTYSNGSFSFSGSGVKATLKSSMDNGRLYYMDYSGNTYCKIIMGSRVENGAEVNYVASVERYTVYSNVSTWLTIYGEAIDRKQNLIDGFKSIADSFSEQMQAIANETNILKYFADEPTLLTELRHYWIEGDYNNDNLAVLDSTKPEEAVDLARELLACGEKELARVCQPRFSVSVNSIKFIKIYAFRKFMYELALGKVITVEKTKDVYYYPALTQMSFSLENGDDTFELVFSNALKLNDWGFTYADLIASASNTSKNVISNWNELMDYSTHKNSIQELLLNPLDKTLRLAEKSMNNQEFVVDNTGILGRKRKTEDLFEPEQVRMINNLLLFTDDSWQTVKTALGKIVYTEDGVDKKAYGLLAEVLVGSLMMSNRMKIQNEGGTITLDKDGITIKNTDGDDVFVAKVDGSLYVGNFVEDDDYEQVRLMLNQSTGDIEISGSRISIDSTYFKVTKEGVVTATSGTIGGWTIDSTGIYKSVAGMLSGDSIIAESLVTGGTSSPVRFYAGQVQQYYTATTTVTTGTLSGSKQGYYNIPQADGVLVSASLISVNPTPTYQTLVWKYDDDTIAIGIQGGNTSTTYTVKVGYYVQESAASSVFKVLSDGSLYTSAIKATGGTIGGFTIDSGIKGYKDGVVSISLTNDGLVLTNSLAKIQVGNFETYYDETAGSTYWRTNGALKIQGMQSGSVITAIELMTESGTSSTSATVSLYAARYGSNIHYKLYLKTSATLYYPKTYTIYWQGGSTKLIGGTEWSDDINSVSLSTSGAEVVIENPSNNAIRFATSSSALSSATVYTFDQFQDVTEKKIFDIGTVTQTSTKNNVILTGNLVPKTANTYALGTSSKAWSAIYSQTGQVSSSDENEKHSINVLNSKYDEFFDLLVPVDYMFNQNTSGRTHTGFVAQGVKNALLSVGLTTKQFAGYCEWEKEDGSLGCGLRYEEFIALNTSQIQKIKKRLGDLEKVVAELKGTI